MSATVFTAQAVEVIQTPSGPGFILFEETYEKNCHPHDPHWGCVGFGRREAILNIIFRNAHVCENGMFQGRSGDITPEGYVRRWMKALQQAHAVADHALEFSSKDKPWTLDEKTVLIEDGITDCPLSAEQVAAWNSGGTLKLDLAEDFDRIAWLTSTHRLSSWKVTGSRGPSSWNPKVDVLDQVFHASKGKEPAVRWPTLVRLFPSESDLFEVREDGVLLCRQRAHSVVGSYVARYAATEIAESGWFARRFKALREICRNAPVIDQTSLLRPFAPEESNACTVEEVNKLLAQYPNGIVPGEVRDRNDRYYVGNAPAYRLLSQLALAA